MTELEPASRELVELESHGPPNLFGSDDPKRTLEKAGAVAAALKDVVKQQKLVANIKGRDHVLVEGWTLLGTLVGVFPVCVWTRKLDNGWEARVEARTLAGAIVGAAEAECLRSESTWSSRDDYALRSMAQTRATSKALRQPLGFIVSLAGYDPTPAEEMEVKRSRPPKQVQAQVTQAPRDEKPHDDLTEATRAQITQLHKLAATLGMDDDEKHERAQVSSFNDLTKVQARTLLSAWQAEANRRAREQAKGGKPKESETIEITDARWEKDEPYVCWVTNEHGEKCINHRPHDADHIFEIPVAPRPDRHNADAVANTSVSQDDESTDRDEAAAPAQAGTAASP